MNRGYQYDFSANSPAVYDVEGRERKARTMVAVLEDYLPGPLQEYELLNVGSSAGIIDNVLANHFKRVTGVDIDAPAVRHARDTYHRDNLDFSLADALSLPFKGDSFDIVVCSHVYEHVPEPEKMLREIHRVLRQNGVCYFAAGNRLMWNEPHYNLPLLSVIPRPLGHLYIRLSGRAPCYHEKHLTYWGLKSLIKGFSLSDYTGKLVRDPERYRTGYMIPPGSTKGKIAALMLDYAYWAFPGYIWLLRKQ